MVMLIRSSPEQAQEGSLSKFKPSKNGKQKKLVIERRTWILAAVSTTPFSALKTWHDVISCLPFAGASCKQYMDMAQHAQYDPASAHRWTHKITFVPKQYKTIQNMETLIDVDHFEA